MLFDIFSGDRCLDVGASDDRGDSAFAQFDAEQFMQRLDDPLVTQMLLMLEEDYRRLQARTEIAVNFQAFRQLAAIEVLAMRADDFMLLRFNHRRLEFR